MSLALLLALSAATAPSSEAPRLFTDWRTISRQAGEAEAAMLKVAQESARNAAPEDKARARALGERVGQIVAAGDCAEGERVARAAGDIGLARAVRDYCYR
jgi:hypothetical protein